LAKEFIALSPAPTCQRIRFLNGQHTIEVAGVLHQSDQRVPRVAAVAARAAFFPPEQAAADAQFLLLSLLVAMRRARDPRCRCSAAAERLLLRLPVVGVAPAMRVAGVAAEPALRQRGRWWFAVDAIR
jgi:hypothetical protein